mmetsp:Transcript_63968/g.152546  ORF Transcript_63968/g.152546 Transcript_63968/m.152546 type:complete len:355 (+) Transcript_63968:96-1160(+)
MAAVGSLAPVSAISHGFQAATSKGYGSFVDMPQPISRSSNLNKLLHQMMFVVPAAAAGAALGARRSRASVVRLHQRVAMQAAHSSRRAGFASLIAVFTGSAAGDFARGGHPAWAAEASSTYEDEIFEVVDGDTVKLVKGGRCRLIGVNTPETVSPKQRIDGAPPDCFGPEASKLTKELLPKGTKVRVELDAGPADRYGRTLAYLYRMPDGLFINAELVKQGVAKRYRVAPNVKYDAQFKQLETEAVTTGKGLWKACPANGGPAPAATTVAATTPAATTQAVANSSAAAADPDLGLANPGNTKNCKDFASWADAKKWFDAYYPLYGDVAKMDGDGDGIPCESMLKKEKAAAKAAK